MTKSKESVERKLEMNNKFPDEIGTAIERRHEKESIPEGGKFSGLGSREEKGRH